MKHISIQRLLKFRISNFEFRILKECEKKTFRINVIIAIMLILPVFCCAQSFKMDDGSSITIENPQGIPLTQHDIEQIKQASMNIKNNEGLNKGEGSESLAQQNYRRQLETELSIEKSRRDTVREYDKLERDTAKTQRLKEGRDVILYREGSRDKQDYKGRRR